MELSTIIELLGAGGDLVIIVFAYILWRLERRVYKTELFIEHRFMNGNGGGKE